MSKRLAKNAPRRRSRRTRHWPWALAVVVVFGGVIAYLASTYGWSGVTGVGDRAPGFVLDDAQGRAVDLDDYLGRQPVVLVFYMTYG